MADKKQIKSFVDAMIRAADIVKRENPTYLVAPMLGSVPLIDGMATATPDFDASRVIYMPASSRILNVNEVIKTWYSNFLDDVVDSTSLRFPKVMGIDEVVSGQSVLRCMNIVDEVIGKKRKQLRQSLVDKAHSRDRDEAIGAINEIDSFSDNEYAFELAQIRERIKHGSYLDNREFLKEDSKFIVEVLRKNLENKLQYKTIGIEDSKKKGSRNSVYMEMREAGRVYPVEVETILTMDDPRLCPARFEEIDAPAESKGHVVFSPKVKDFEVTPEYISFLRDIANYVGKNPGEVHPVNMGSILDSSRYLKSAAESVA